MDKVEEDLIKSNFSAEISFELDKEASENLNKIFGMSDKLTITVEKLWNNYNKLKQENEMLKSQNWLMKNEIDTITKNYIDKLFFEKERKSDVNE